MKLGKEFGHYLEIKKKKPEIDKQTEISESIRQEVIELISQNELDTALSKMKKYFEDNKQEKAYDGIINLSRRYHQNKDEFDQNKKTQEQYQVETSLISSSLLNILRLNA